MLPLHDQFPACQMGLAGFTPVVLTFPDEDVSVGSVVKNETLAGHQSILGERALLGHHSDLQVSACIRHLRRVTCKSSDIMGSHGELIG